MIRPFIPSDLDTVMQIWLDGNISGHSFIAPQYWHSNFETVKSLLPQADVFVFEENGTIKGFIGIQDKTHIAGLFVSPSFQGRGIGRKLIKTAKNSFSTLKLAVYRRNEKAVCFYSKQGFAVSREQTDQETGETEYIMTYSSSAKSKLK